MSSILAATSQPDPQVQPSVVSWGSCSYSVSGYGTYSARDTLDIRVWHNK